MTHSGGQPHTNIGDRGQRYEVSVFDEGQNKRIVLGWADNPTTAAKMATAAELRPSWTFAQVRDRHCAFCDGAGVIGIPGARCDWCEGTGLTPFTQATP